MVLRRWMKGVLKAPDGKRPHPPRTDETEGISIKGRGCEILLRHEGLAPVRLPSSKPVRALFKRAYSCRTSDRSACLFPRVPGLLLRGRAVPFSRNEAPRPAGRAETAPTRLIETLFAIVKRRQPFACSRDRRNPKRRPKDRRNNPRRTGDACRTARCG